MAVDAGGAMLLCFFVFLFADHLVLLLFSQDFVKAAEFVDNPNGSN